jgi:TldD protein
MIKYIAKILFLIFPVTLSTGVLAQGSEDKLLTILKEELNREMEGLAESKDPVYYLDYRVDATKSYNFSSTFGSLTASDESQNRILTCTVKVGDYQLDNTHNSNQAGGRYGGGMQIPIEDHPMAITQSLWNVTQGAYNQAKMDYRAVLSQQRHNRDSTTTSADFTKENISNYYEAPIQLEISDDELKKWERLTKEYSAAFLHQDNVQSADVNLGINYVRKYFVSSEGTTVVQNLTYAFLMIEASTLATDGDIVPLFKSYFAFDPKELPAEAEVEQDIAKMIDQLEKLRVAPLAEPFSGPAILSARSAGVFFHEIFGHRVEGHRLKQANDGQTFREKIGAKVLPKSMSVIFDPSMKQMNGKDLIGTYKYDDQGVEGKKVTVVKDGVLKTFLMSRSPLDEVTQSNGHGRAASGLQPVARQSNLLIAAGTTHKTADLRKMLIKECKKQDKAYGYLFQDVIGGFTYTDRNTPNVFNIMPTEVYRIFVDGRADELVRGVDLIGTPLSMFAEIKSAGSSQDVFTGFCGAESGSIPVSATAPSLFVRRIETQKKPVQNQEAPILRKPTYHTDDK